MKSRWQDRSDNRFRARRRRAPRIRRLSSVLLRGEALEARIVLSSDPLLLADPSPAEEAGPNSLAGHVYIDANQDGQRDASEMGVPGSLITISGIDGEGTAVERSILTLADGSYLFAGLADGTYDVSQHQPTSMHNGQTSVGDQGGDGGDNQVSNITLADAVAATGYDFGELGLRADYISVNLHLASNPPIEEVARDVVARGEAVAGHTALAAQIRAAGVAPSEDPADTDQGQDNETPTNNVPVATEDGYTLDEDGELIVAADEGLLDNDSDADSDPLTVVLVSDATHGQLNLDPNGSFTYLPEADFSGDDTFSYRVSDGTDESDAVTVTISVTPVNDSPVAVGDEYHVVEGETLNVDGTEGVLTNDSDVEGESLKAVVVTDAAHGELLLDASGAFSYVPEAGFSGVDSFSYRTSDGTSESAVATVTIAVTPLNGVPVAVDDQYTATEDLPLEIGDVDGVLQNDSDTDGDSLTAVPVSLPSHGTLNFDDDGSFTYTPDANFSGTDEFTYRTSDGTTESAIATVRITVTAVNDVPVGSADHYDAMEDTELNIGAADGVLQNDSDGDADTLTAKRLISPVHGTLNFNTDGSFSYVADAGYFGSDQFSYLVNDSKSLSAPVTVTIQVVSVNDRPAGATDQYSVTAGETLQIGVAEGVLQNDSDADGDSLTVALGTVAPAHGTLTLNDDGSFSFVPDAGFTGVDQFTYVASDGADASEEVTVNITVTVNEMAPDLVAFAQALADAGVILFGTAWCAHCTEQKELFEDGGEQLPFVEVTNPDGMPNEIGIEEEITVYPTWDFGGGNRAEGLLDLDTISLLSGVEIPQAKTPFVQPILDALSDPVDAVDLLSGSPLHIPLDGYDPNGGELTYTISSDNPAVQTEVLEGNRSMRVSVASYGDMVFELYDGRAPRVTERIVELAESGFYEGIIFHRVMDNFVIQGGDPTGTGSGGSSLGDFDGQFHVDLQHNRTGILSMAKTTDDTNDSQFFVTEGTSRHLDFNHSIFGQLVEGFHVLEAITEVPTDSGNRPITEVTIESVDIFTDPENAVLKLSALEGTSGEANITVTVTDTNGNSFDRTFHVAVTPDGTDGGPFLSDIPEIVGAINTPVHFQLEGNDVEGDPVWFDAIKVGSVDYTFFVDSTTGEVTVNPPQNYTGSFEILVRARAVTQSDTHDDFDSQLVTITIEL